ncbi:MAG: hypothetical protein J0I12_00860 [Candidatus Eremiobacteraeota bacterium]|nr:hypothetical protein [Candidatus Eremiobacteraeota bacterium]
MATFLVLLIGIPLTSLLFTYGAGRLLGPGAARFCFFLSLLPVALATWQMVMVWRDSRPEDQGMGYGISGIAMLISLTLSGFSLLGLWLARRRPNQAEAGTGLNP